MHGPPLTGWLLTLLCAATGTYCLVRARTGSAAQRGQVRGEALMGLAMAVMALPASAVTPPGWLPWLYAAVFTAAAVRAVVHRHPHHAVGSFAMVYMALAMTAVAGGGTGAGPFGSHPAHGGGPHPVAQGHGLPLADAGHGAPGGLPLLTGALLVYYAVAVLAGGARLIPVGAGAEAAGAEASRAEAAGVVRADGAVAAGPGEVLAACRVAMGIAMFAMLLTL